MFSKLTDVEEANVYGVQVPDCDGRCGMVAIKVKTDRYEDHLAEWFEGLHVLPAYARPIFVRILLSGPPNVFDTPEEFFPEFDE